MSGDPNGDPKTAQKRQKCSIPGPFKASTDPISISNDPKQFKYMPVTGRYLMNTFK